MREIVEGKTLHTEFDSWGEFVDRTGAPVPPGRSTRSSIERGSWFAGTENMKQAQDLARLGWSEGADAVKRLSLKLFDVLASRVEREQVTYDVEGMGIDIARYCDGEPECWQDIRPVVTEGAGRRIIRITVSMGISAGVPQQVITARGAAAVALAELLEHSGHGVELNIVQSSGSTKNEHILVPVKASHQPLDLDRVAFALAHPSTLRRLCFAVMERMPDEFYPICHDSYGMPIDVPAKYRGDVYLAKMHYSEEQWMSEESAKRWVLTELKKQGVVLGEE